MPTKISDFYQKNRKKPDKNSKHFDGIAFRRVEGTRNIHLLYHLLPTVEAYSDFFDDDSVSRTDDYQGWLDNLLGFVDSASPWFYVVTVDDKPKGLMWVAAWESYGAIDHAAEFGGLTSRGIAPEITLSAIDRFVSSIFRKTTVHIVRAEFAADNRAVRRCLYRAGFSHPEPRRCLKIRHGKEIPGQYLSVTRPEWEALHLVQKEEKQ